MHALATSSQQETLEQQVQKAPLIIMGCILETNVHLPNNPSLGLSAQYHLLEVQKVLKGKLDEKIIFIRQFGTPEQPIHSMPSFEPQEKVLVILNTPQSDESYPLLGLSDAKLAIEQEHKVLKILQAKSEKEQPLPIKGSAQPLSIHPPTPSVTNAANTAIPSFVSSPFSGFSQLSILIAALIVLLLLFIKNRLKGKK